MFNKVITGFANDSLERLQQTVTPLTFWLLTGGGVIQDVMPASGEYVPASHAVHVEVPMELEKLPGTQREHAMDDLAAEYFPG
jgi:hypothetical protein